MFNDFIIYKFEDFELDEEEGELFQNQTKVELEPKQFAALLLLVKNAGRTINKDQLANDVWGYAVMDNSITNCISQIRSKLDESDRKRFIKTITGKGYKFIVPVMEVEKSSRNLVSKEFIADESPDADFSGYKPDGLVDNQPTSEQNDLNPQSFSSLKFFAATVGMVVAVIFFNFGMSFRVCAGECFEQTVFIFLACVFYGILTGIGVLLECAYQFDKYGWNAVKMIPSIVFVNAGAMFAALTVAGNLLQAGNIYAFWKGLLFLVSGAIISCVLAALVLPNLPVTAARFQTQSAIGAFCKNVFIYFFPLYTIFGLLIFCFVYGSAEITKSIAFPIAFAVIWMIFFVFSYLSTNYLSDNLLTERDGKKYKYHGLFSQLLHLRTIFCFITTLNSIVWYFFHALTHLPPNK